MNKEETIQIQQELIDVLESQVIDLTMMSKIELGDDVIAEIKRLKDSLNQKEDETDYLLSTDANKTKLWLSRVKDYLKNQNKND